MLTRGAKAYSGSGSVV